MWLLKISLLQSGRKIDEGLRGERGDLPGVCCRGLGEFGLGQSRWRSEVNNMREFKVNIFSDGGLIAVRVLICFHLLVYTPFGIILPT